jgi:hypothetical protein
MVTRFWLVWLMKKLMSLCLFTYLFWTFPQWNSVWCWLSSSSALSNLAAWIASTLDSYLEMLTGSSSSSLLLIPSYGEHQWMEEKVNRLFWKTYQQCFGALVGFYNPPSLTLKSCPCFTYWFKDNKYSSYIFVQIVKMIVRERSSIYLGLRWYVWNEEKNVIPNYCDENIDTFPMSTFFF